MGNTSKEKNIISKKIASWRHSSDFFNSEDKNQINEISRKNADTLVNFEIDEIDKDNDSYEPDIISNINPLYISNCFEINNISSNNSTNDNKAIDKYDFINPFLKQETVSILPKKEKIFEIHKINKKIGRIKKNSGYIGKHNKLSEDNVIRKIKRRFLENVRIYINKEYKKYYLIKKININNNWLKKISPKCYGQIKKIDNIKWFNSKIYEVFSENLSLRYSSHSLDSNKKNIQRLLLSNESNTIIIKKNK